MQGMMKAALIGRSRFPRARPGQWVAANAVSGLRSIRKVANGLAFTILLLFAAVAVALLVSCASSTQIEGANPTSSHAMHGTPKDFEPSRPDEELWTTGYDQSLGCSGSLGAKSPTSSSTR